MENDSYKRLMEKLGFSLYNELENEMSLSNVSEDVADCALHAVDPEDVICIIKRVKQYRNLSHEQYRYLLITLPRLTKPYIENVMDVVDKINEPISEEVFNVIISSLTKTTIDKSTHISELLSNTDLLAQPNLYYIMSSYIIRLQEYNDVFQQPKTPTQLKQIGNILKNNAFDLNGEHYQKIYAVAARNDIAPTDENFYRSLEIMLDNEKMKKSPLLPLMLFAYEKNHQVFNASQDTIPFLVKAFTNDLKLNQVLWLLDYKIPNLLETVMHSIHNNHLDFAGDLLKLAHDNKIASDKLLLPIDQYTYTYMAPTAKRVAHILQNGKVAYDDNDIYLLSNLGKRELEIEKEYALNRANQVPLDQVGQVVKILEQRQII